LALVFGEGLFINDVILSSEDRVANTIKGQIKTKADLGAIDSPEKQTNNFGFLLLRAQMCFRFYLTFSNRRLLFGSLQQFDRKNIV
jgi:hypothetical protein